ncbi:MAG: DUF2304 domain-containing protein [bacterium]
MLSITIFQLFFALIAFVFWLNALLKFFRRERSQTFFKFFANSVVWLGIMLFSIFPSQVHLFSEKLGFGESLNTFIFIGFVIVFMIIFKIINMIERTERNISEIVRKEALSEIKNQ